MSYTRMQGLDRRERSGRRRGKSRKRRSREREGRKRSRAGGGPRSGYTRGTRRCRTTLNSTATPIPHPVYSAYFTTPQTRTPLPTPISRDHRRRSLSASRYRRRRWRRRRLLVDLRVRVARTSRKVSFGRRRHGRRRRAGRRGVPRGMQSGVGGPFRCCTFYVFLVFKRICTTKGVAPRPLRIIWNSTTSTGRKL